MEFSLCIEASLDGLWRGVWVPLREIEGDDDSAPDLDPGGRPSVHVPSVAEYAISGRDLA